MREPRAVTEAIKSLTEEQVRLSHACGEALTAFCAQKISLNDACDAVRAWNSAAPIPGIRQVHPLYYLRQYGDRSHPLFESHLERFVGNGTWNGKIYGNSIYLNGEKTKLTDEMIKDHEIRTKI